MKKILNFRLLKELILSSVFVLVVGVNYAGKPLKPETRYEWKVTVWNQKGNASEASSSFETGLMNPDPDLSAWSGARWIGGGSDDLVFFSHYPTKSKSIYFREAERGK